MSSSQTLPPPQGPEYVRCSACGHIEPEHRPDAGPCLVCDCAAYSDVDRAAVQYADAAEALRWDLYDDLDSFARQNQIASLRHPQIRDHLAVFLTEGLLRRAAAAPAAVSVPPPAPRAVWREAAVFVEAMNEACDSKRPCESCTTREDVADALRLVADVPVPPPAPRADAGRRERYAAAIADGFRAFDADTTSDAYLDAELLDAVVAVADAEQAATRADALREAADMIDAETRQAKADEILEPDKFRPCRDASAQLRRLADEVQPVNELIDDYLRFLRGQGPKPDLSDLPPQQREAIAGQFEVVRALADRDPVLPPLDRDPVALRLGLYGDDHSCAESGCSGEPGPVAGEQQNETPEAEAQPFTVQVWPLARVLTEVRCGSEDWSWEEEWADLDRRHAETGYLAKLEQQIRATGITMPVLIGTDGRLWDGHHRLRIAVRLGIGYVPVEVPAVVAQPGKEPS